jgi:hypothetical protein
MKSAIVERELGNEAKVHLMFPDRVSLHREEFPTL